MMPSSGHGARRLKLQALPGLYAICRQKGGSDIAWARGDLVVIGLDLEGVCVSTGAACTSGSIAPSAVLLALGLPPAQAREAVRFSLGADNTEAEVDAACELVAAVVARVRASSAGGQGL